MVALATRIRSTLQDNRFFLQGAQVLMLFQQRAAILPGYEDLSSFSKTLCILGIFPAVILMVLLLMPIPVFHVAEHGKNSEGYHNFLISITKWALLLFGVTLGSSFVIAVDSTFSQMVAILTAIVLMLFGFACWFGLSVYKRRKQNRTMNLFANDHKEEGKEEPHRPDVTERISRVLTEGGMILPGNTALLSFGFITMLLDAFAKLPKPVQYVQFFGIVMICISTILLMTPAAYHRLVDGGEETEEFYALAHKLVVASLIPFSLGINAGMFVSIYRVVESYLLCTISAGFLFLISIGFWFVFPLLQRRRMAEKDTPSVPQEGSKSNPAKS